MISKLKTAVKYLRSSLGWDQFLSYSWSQEGEDLILMRILELKPKTTGFYIDIGAHHPKRFSNTYAFYKKGWHGVNIDAMPGSMKLFNKQRHRDINLEISVANEQKQLTYFQFNEPALNTFSQELAISRDGLRSYKIIATKEIEAYPLKTILDKYLNSDQSIDFMTIDVEGLDFEVLQSNDWSKYRPKVVLVEILVNSLDLVSVNEDPTSLFLKDKGYHLCAKTFNTAFFISDEFVAEYKSTS